MNLEDITQIIKMSCIILCINFQCIFFFEASVAADAAKTQGKSKDKRKEKGKSSNLESDVSVLVIDSL